MKDTTLLNHKKKPQPYKMENQIEMSAAEVVALFKTTKAQRISFVNQIIEDVIEGRLNALDIHLQVKCMEDIVKQITSNEAFKDALLDEANKYEGRSFEYQNAKIEKKEVGVKFNYANCSDVVYQLLSQQGDEITAKLKERETFLKGIPSEGIKSVDEETGEEITIYPPSKSSTTSVVVTLK